MSRLLKRSHVFFSWVLITFIFVSSHFLYSGVSYDPENRRDPMVPLIGPGGTLTAARTAGDFMVQGIIHDPAGDSLVLIDDDLYREGDSVGEATIISILKDRVIIQQKDENKILWIREEIFEGDNHNAPR